MISSQMKEKQSMDHLKSLKEDTFFVSRKAEKNSVRNLKANINFVFCVINVTIKTLTEQFHWRDE